MTGRGGEEAEDGFLRSLWRLFHIPDPHVLLDELRVLPQDFALERITLLAAHRRDVERVIRRGDRLNGFLRPAMNSGDPGVCSTVSTVEVI